MKSQPKQPSDLAGERGAPHQRPTQRANSKPRSADEQNTRSMRRLDPDNRAGLDAADETCDDPAQWPGL